MIFFWARGRVRGVGSDCAGGHFGEGAGGGGLGAEGLSANWGGTVFFRRFRLNS
jgi:hypothetical protein